MRKTLALTSAIAALAALTAVCALAGQRAGMTFRTFTIEGQSVQGQLRGPWEWTGAVTAKGLGLTLSADRLKLYPTPDGRDADRIEATGNIRVLGRYLAADRTEWEVTGKAEAATYERGAAQGVLRGAVSFQAKNRATGAELSAEADKLIYDFRTERFRFERGEQPVRMEWREPEPTEPSAGQTPPAE